MEERFGCSIRWWGSEGGEAIPITKERKEGGRMPAPLQPRPPLGLPKGSVRALLTLLILAVVIVQVIRGATVEPLWIRTLMIALAHYFTSRRFISLPPEVIRRLESEGYLEEERNPLYLPRLTIRLVIALIFIALAAHLYKEDKLFQPQALSLVGVVFAYLLGTVFRGLLDLWPGWRQSGAGRGWEDLKALVVLVVLAITATVYLFDRADLIPQHARPIPLGLVLFYFGSR